VDAREGGEWLGSVYSRPGLELAAVASSGAGGGSTVARPGQEGRCPFIWATREPVSDHKTIRDILGSAR
jgi:hypothetical protein